MTRATSAGEMEASGRGTGETEASGRGTGDTVGRATGSGDTSRARALLSATVRPAAIFVATRAGMLSVAWALSFVLHESLVSTITRWDSGAYVNIARYGYPSRLPPASAPSHAWQLHIAFFPLFPIAIRIAHDVTGLGYLESGYGVAFVLGLLGAILVWAFVRDRYGASAADRATALVFCFPGAYVLSMTYSETLIIPLIAGCLIALRHRRWVIAGVLAALTTATDPSGIAILAPCAFAAFMAIRSRRDWASLASIVMAPLGIIAFFAYLWARVGTPLAWFKVEQRGWSEQTTPRAVYDQFLQVLHHGVEYPNYTVMVAGAILAVPLLAYAVAHRAEGTVLTYGIAVYAISLVTVRHGFMPRNLLHAFPLIAIAGVGLRHHWFATALIISALLMGALGIVSFGSLGLTP